MRVAVVMAALVLAAGSEAHAGIYTDDLSKCLVRSASAADQQELVFWVYSAMSRHPQVKPYSKVTEADQVKSSKTAAELMQRLLTKDCRKETIEALRYEGTGTMEAAFGVLGQVAMRNLTTDAAVAGAFEDMASYLDKDSLEALGRDAGIRPSGGK